MAKDIKRKMAVLTEQDIKIIEKDPAGLADYIVEQKISSAKKTMIIITILAMAASFAAGVFVGMGWTRESIPNNVVQIKVGNDGEVAEAEGK